MQAVQGSLFTHGRIFRHLPPKEKPGMYILSLGNRDWATAAMPLKKITAEDGCDSWLHNLQGRLRCCIVSPLAPTPVLRPSTLLYLRSTWPCAKRTLTTPGCCSMQASEMMSPGSMFPPRCSLEVFSRPHWQATVPLGR